MTVRIITDSTTDVTPEAARQLKISVDCAEGAVRPGENTATALI